VRYYKLEIVKEILRTKYDASCLSAAKPRKEAWARVLDGHAYRALLAWSRGEDILSETEVHHVADALRIDFEELIAKVRERGGLWLGPAPG
jgi:hypothetical protein